MAKAYCPSCDGVINVEKPKLGGTLTCRECNTQLEVISVDPFEIDFPLDYEESWDDDADKDDW